MPYQERRLTDRIPAEFQVNYIHEGDYLISFTKDISADGMFIYTENPPAVGEEPKLIFTIDGTEHSVYARVVWANTECSPRDTGVGVQFIDPPDALRTAIMQLIKRIAILDRET